MLSLIVPIIFFALLLMVIYGISFLCFRGVLQLIAHGVHQPDIRRPVNIRDRN